MLDLSGLLSDHLDSPAGNDSGALQLGVDEAIARVQRDPWAAEGLLSQLQQARRLLQTDLDAAKKLLRDICDAEALLTLTGGLRVAAAGCPPRDGKQRQQRDNDAAGRSAPKRSPLFPSSRGHGAASAALALPPPSSWRDDWQGCVLAIVQHAPPESRGPDVHAHGGSEGADGGASPRAPLPAFSALQRELLRAISLSQQSVPARSTLLPLELQRVHNEATTSVELLHGLCLLLRQFVRPLYHTCGACSARRLALREPVPPAGRFTCGHPACLFCARVCKAGGWDEAKDCAILFPEELLDLLGPLPDEGPPVCAEEQEQGQQAPAPPPRARVLEHGGEAASMAEASGQQQRRQAVWPSPQHDGESAWDSDRQPRQATRQSSRESDGSDRQQQPQRQKEQQQRRHHRVPGTVPPQPPLYPAAPAAQHSGVEVVPLTHALQGSLSAAHAAYMQPAVAHQQQQQQSELQQFATHAPPLPHGAGLTEQQVHVQQLVLMLQQQQQQQLAEELMEGAGPGGPRQPRLHTLTRPNSTRGTGDGLTVLEGSVGAVWPAADAPLPGIPNWEPSAQLQPQQYQAVPMGVVFSGPQALAEDAASAALAAPFLQAGQGPDPADLQALVMQYHLQHQLLLQGEAQLRSAAGTRPPSAGQPAAAGAAAAAAAPKASRQPAAEPPRWPPPPSFQRRAAGQLLQQQQQQQQQEGKHQQGQQRQRSSAEDQRSMPPPPVAQRKQQPAVGGAQDALPAACYRLPAVRQRDAPTATANTATASAASAGRSSSSSEERSGERRQGNRTALEGPSASTAGAAWADHTHGGDRGALTPQRQPPAKSHSRTIAESGAGARHLGGGSGATAAHPLPFKRPSSSGNSGSGSETTVREEQPYKRPRTDQHQQQQQQGFPGGQVVLRGGGGLTRGGGESGSAGRLHSLAPPVTAAAAAGPGLVSRPSGGSSSWGHPSYASDHQQHDSDALLEQPSIGTSIRARSPDPHFEHTAAAQQQQQHEHTQVVLSAGLMAVHGGGGRRGIGGRQLPPAAWPVAANATTSGSAALAPLPTSTSDGSVDASFEAAASQQQQPGQGQGPSLLNWSLASRGAGAAAQATAAGGGRVRISLMGLAGGGAGAGAHLILKPLKAASLPYALSLGGVHS